MTDFFFFVLVGAIGQLIDTSTSMGYGMICRSFLSLKYVTKSSVWFSMVIHLSEVVSTLVSGTSHYLNKNINKDLFIKLICSGLLGCISGILLIQIYTDFLAMGVSITYILIAFRLLHQRQKIFLFKRKAYIFVLGFFGGFVDAIGGGGWGIIVTPVLLMTKKNSKEMIGTVCASEFIITLVQSIVFIFSEPFDNSIGTAVAGLMIGSVVAMPIAIILNKRVSQKQLIKITAFILLTINVYNLYQNFVR